MSEFIEGSINERDDLQAVGEIEYGDQVLTVTVGRNPDLVAQVVENSKLPLMRRKVPKDATERFSDPEAFEKWYAKGRFLTTVHAAGEVALITWMGKSSFANEISSLRKKGAEIDFEAPEGSEHTFAIRNYRAGEAKPDGAPMSLARIAMVEVRSLYAQSLEQAGGVVLGEKAWLETNLYQDEEQGTINNSVFLYGKAGYQQLGTYRNPDPSNPEMRVAMVRPLAGGPGEQGQLNLPN
jgi:hypothetical protein